MSNELAKGIRKATTVEKDEGPITQEDIDAILPDLKQGYEDVHGLWFTEDGLYEF